MFWGQEYEPGHKSRRISSLYDENALVGCSREGCGLDDSITEKDYKNRLGLV